MRWSTVAYAVLGGTSLVVIATALWARPKSKRARRIALIGDSLAVGLTPQLAQLAAAQGVPFKGEGHVGSTVAQWLATPSWGSWVAGFNPSVTLIELGTNDYMNPAPDLAAYRRLAAKFPNAVWIMPPDEPSAPMPKVRAAIMQAGVPVIPEATGLHYAPDGIHPSSYGSWAQFIWQHLPL